MGQNEMLNHWRKQLEEARRLHQQPEEADSLRDLIEIMARTAAGERNRLEHTPATSDETNYRLCVNEICAASAFTKDAVPSAMNLGFRLNLIEEALDRIEG
jgi:hypothetical protein